MWTGRLPYCLAFLARSSFSAHVLTLSVSAALGQFYIFSMVQSHLKSDEKRLKIIRKALEMRRKWLKTAENSSNLLALAGFGALALAAAMNLRQVLTILLASLEQPKPMGWLQRVARRVFHPIFHRFSRLFKDFRSISKVFPRFSMGICRI